MAHDLDFLLGEAEQLTEAKAFGDWLATAAARRNLLRWKRELEAAQPGQAQGKGKEPGRQTEDKPRQKPPRFKLEFWESITLTSTRNGSLKASYSAKDSGQSSARNPASSLSSRSTWAKCVSETGTGR
jgi:hypothetical protein